MLGGRADSLRSLRERWTVGRRVDGARAESAISVAGGKGLSLR